MKLTFIKRGQQRNVTHVVRDDGVMLEVPGPDCKSPIPLDLAHCIAERELGLKGPRRPAPNVVCGAQGPTLHRGGAATKSLWRGYTATGGAIQTQSRVTGLLDVGTRFTPLAGT